ncbi:hypothetical protein Ade02nite_15240 [Paractinoplanes deccanensis]|uniref:Response regulatory domain-containing protein n=1 Tax=Paractinoplanes deccanensis TaxID=113561 RepID=A0ABQ3XYQ8_9ACTN|nr:response regulator [Actinoplanes deccanensis]GID72883.1 hypothetical protein Ade02nite_15240 [Actinoplanes deccanensis]
MATILVADDEPDVADLFTTVLTSAGHTVHTVPDGPSALARIAELKPDLSVLDHYMPEMTGLQVAQRLRDDPGTTGLPLLMVSACAPPTALLYCNVVLAKPVPLGQFRSVVSDLLTPHENDPLRDPDRLRAAGVALDGYSDHTAQRVDRFAAEVAAEVGADMAAVTVVLADSVAVYGAHAFGGWIREAGGMPAEWTPCARVVRAGEPVVIDDLAADPDLAGTPLVTISQVRSYAGVPLAGAAGHRIGTVCVMGHDPGAFSAATVDQLTARAAEATAFIRP